MHCGDCIRYLTASGHHESAFGSGSLRSISIQRAWRARRRHYSITRKSRPNKRCQWWWPAFISRSLFSIRQVSVSRTRQLCRHARAYMYIPTCVRAAAVRRVHATAVWTTEGEARYRIARLPVARGFIGFFLRTGMTINRGGQLAGWPIIWFISRDKSGAAKGPERRENFYIEEEIPLYGTGRSIYVCAATAAYDSSWWTQETISCSENKSKRDFSLKEKERTNYGQA